MFRRRYRRSDDVDQKLSSSIRSDDFQTLIIVVLLTYKFNQGYPVDIVRKCFLKKLKSKNWNRNDQ